MRYFFTFETDLPLGVGFRLWGAGHIFFIVLTAVLCAAMGRVYKSSRRRRRIDMTVGLLLLILELTYNAVLFAGGHLDRKMLPLHLCAISVLMCIIYTFTKKEWIGQYIYCMGMPGALCALLFPDWCAYPIFSYFSLSSFVIHAVLVIYGFMLLYSGQVRPEIRKVCKPMAFLLVCAAGVYMFNYFSGTNYMFLMRPSPGSPLEILPRILPKKLYLLGYAVIVAAVEAVLYLPWEVCRRKNCR